MLKEKILGFDVLKSGTLVVPGVGPFDFTFDEEDLDFTLRLVFEVNKEEAIPHIIDQLVDEKTKLMRFVNYHNSDGIGSLWHLIGTFKNKKLSLNIAAFSIGNNVINNGVMVVHYTFLWG